MQRNFTTWKDINYNWSASLDSARCLVDLWLADGQTTLALYVVNGVVLKIRLFERERKHSPPWSNHATET